MRIIPGHYKKTANKRTYYMYLSHIIKNFNILSNSQISNFSQSDYFYEDLKMFKTQVESQAASECFHCKVLNILISLLWSLWEWLQGEYWLYIYFLHFFSFVVLFTFRFWLDQHHSKFIWTSAFAIIIFRSELCILLGLIFFLELVTRRVSLLTGLLHSASAGICAVGT